MIRLSRPGMYTARLARSASSPSVTHLSADIGFIGSAHESPWAKFRFIDMHSASVQMFLPFRKKVIGLYVGHYRFLSCHRALIRIFSKLIQLCKRGQFAPP